MKKVCWWWPMTIFYGDFQEMLLLLLRKYIHEVKNSWCLARDVGITLISGGQTIDSQSLSLITVPIASVIRHQVTNKTITRALVHCFLFYLFSRITWFVTTMSTILGYEIVKVHSYLAANVSNVIREIHFE